MSDPKDKSDDFTSLFDMADFDHKDDQETEDYFAKKAQETQEELNENESEYQDETQSSIDITPLQDDELTQELDESIEEIPDQEDDQFNNFADFDDGHDHDDDHDESNHEMTQVNFNPQELLNSEDSFNDIIVDDEDDNENEQSFDFDSPDKEEAEEEEEENNQEIDDEQPIEAPCVQVSQDPPVLASTSLKEETSSKYTQKYEDFEDIQKFANTTHYSTIKSLGNPAFSIIISDIKYQEDSNKIFATLQELGFINADNKEIIKKGLDRGSAIISRVSEFAAFFLYHQVHLLDIKLKIGPSDLIYTSSVSEHDQAGAVGSQNLLQNKEDSKKVQNEILSSILLSTSSEIIGYVVKDFLGTCRQSLSFQSFPQAGDQEPKLQELKEKDAFENTYKKVEAEIKKQIQEKGGNAGIDMKVEIIPLFQEQHQTYTYQVALQCHAIWIDKI